MDNNLPMQATDTTNFDEFIKQIEEDLIQQIITSLKGRKLSVEKSQELAKEFLDLLPAKDKEDLLNKLNKLGNEFSEAKKVFADFAIPYEEEKRQRLLNAMREQIKNGNIEKAIEIAKNEYQ